MLDDWRGRCDWCRWPLDPEAKMCRWDSCSQRPMPELGEDGERRQEIRKLEAELARLREENERLRALVLDYKVEYERECEHRERWCSKALSARKERDALKEEVEQLRNPMWPEIVRHLNSLIDTEHGKALIRWHEKTEEAIKAAVEDREETLRALSAERERIQVLRKRGCYPENKGKTHFEGCWRDRGHHECAIEALERAQQDVRDLAGLASTMTLWQEADYSTEEFLSDAEALAEELLSRPSIKALVNG